MQRRHTTRIVHLLLIPAMLVLATLVTPVSGQHGGGGRGMMDGMMGDMMDDMQVLHQLFEHRHEITRQVTRRDDGVETVTESTNPDVTRLLHTHVMSMLARVKDGRPIHRRDPLFAELFRYADRVEASHEATPRGIRVVETSQDGYVAKLLQAHADVVSAFIANGQSEMMKDHPVPAR